MAQQQSAAFDVSQLINHFGGDQEFAAECAQLFVSELPGMLAPLRAGVETGSAIEIQRAAHALKGAASNFYAEAVVRTAERMDHNARDGRIDDAPALLHTLETELATLVVELER